jgi:hypothetical protein
MADVINLRLARKARARRSADALAAENRARHGQSRAERTANAAAAARAARDLAAKRREDPDANG